MLHMAEKNRKWTAFSSLMLASIFMVAASMLLRGDSNVSDFTKGTTTGIWIGLLLLAVIRAKRGSDSDARR